MDAQHYDVIVIGSGPGGEGAAIKCAKAGKRVAVVERYVQVGGGCTHWGTIPSKKLIHVIQQFAELQRSPLFGAIARPARISYADIIGEVEAVVVRQAQERRGFYERNNVTVLEGHARFTDPRSVVVDHADGRSLEYAADAYVLAPGAHPYHPDDVPFGLPRVVDSDTVLKLAEIPASLTVYGAGVVGCEYASAFRALGVKVNLVNVRARLLEFLDDEITDALSYHLRDEGILIRHSEQYQRVEVLGDGVVLHLETGKKIKSDVLLWANGRTGNSAGLGLERAGIATDHRGNIVVDGGYRTAQPHIYAVGDIVGFPSTASAAYNQGRYVGMCIAEERCEPLLVTGIPTGIYTTPEIGTAGATERELTQRKIPYEVGHAQFKHLARAQITGRTTGMLKLLFHRETLALLGIHCFGRQAAEIVHIGQAIMAQKGEGNSIAYFANATFNYPTMAEAYRVAALNGLNRIF
jgi:NAD(P) transhydrogenase